MKTVSLFRGSSGLSNKTDPARLGTTKGGVVELATAVNVKIDDTGRVSRRKGTTLKTSGNFHSLFSVGQYAFVVSGTSLYLLEPDFTLTTIATVSDGERVSYCKAGKSIYWCNGVENGVITNQTNASWAGEPYVGPTTQKTFSDPPVGYLLDLFNSRIYIAVEEEGYHVLYFTEPFAWAWVNLVEDYMEFADRITMVRAAKNVLYVGTETETFSLVGSTPQDVMFTKIADYGVIEGTDVMVPGTRIGDGQIMSEVAMWASTEGICVGGPEGYFVNMTERKLYYPDAMYGAGLYKDGAYLVTLEP